MKKDKIKIFTKKDLLIIIVLLGYELFLTFGFFIRFILKPFFEMRMINIILIGWIFFVSFIYPRIIHKYASKIKKIFGD